jgi:hypothetical protein
MSEGREPLRTPWGIFVANLKYGAWSYVRPRDYWRRPFWVMDTWQRTLENAINRAWLDDYRLRREHRRRMRVIR